MLQTITTGPKSARNTIGWHKDLSNRWIVIINLCEVTRFNQMNLKNIFIILIMFFSNQIKNISQF